MIDKTFDHPRTADIKPAIHVDVPKMDTAFTALGLSDALAFGVQEMGYITPTPIRAQAIPVVPTHAPTPLIRSPSDSSTVTTRATKHASNAELPAIASEPDGLLLDHRQHDQRDAREHQHVEQQGARHERHAVQRRRGDDQPDRVAEDRDGQAADEAHDRMIERRRARAPHPERVTVAAVGRRLENRSPGWVTT